MSDKNCSLCRLAKFDEDSPCPIHGVFLETPGRKQPLFHEGEILTAAKLNAAFDEFRLRKHHHHRGFA
jgi:hypothetical protein